MHPLSLYRYKLRLDLPFLKEREGLLLSYIDAMNTEAWVEIAPLPNWSKESLEEVVRQTKELLRAPSFPTLEELKGLPLAPSLSFALQSMHLPSQKAPFSIPLCGLLIGTSKQIMKKAEALQEVGCKLAKVKIQNFSIEEARDLLKELSSIFHLRIDSNRYWKKEDLSKVLSKTPFEKIEYLEEPFKDPEDLLMAEWPIALDETLRHFPHIKLKKIPSLKAVIVKPTLEGFFDSSSLKYAHCKESKTSLILSSSFETGVGISKIAHLAHILGLQEPMGLDTLRYFHDELLESPIHIEKGRMVFPEKVSPKKSMLEKLL